MKNERKITQGPIREKARTMKKLVNAVGSILRKNGYTGLSGYAIAKHAKVDRKLIYAYFGSVDKLIEAYIKKTDFWTPDTNAQVKEILENPRKRGAEDLKALLINQMRAVHGNRDLQQTLLWELAEKNKVLTRVSEEREFLGERLFPFIEDDFNDSGLDLRAILAILISGTYYSALHAANNGSTFCGIDMNGPEGKQRFENALRQMVELCYEKVK
ncbi:TetR/AcrR family transcriptional regulator [Marinilongibacter aquaticus]|uniref:TetR/AcrR family transcriptional regulator n=1 Tax=Marinilongibacter aquaticus TaxID=2975157 RepID=UPI0021BD0CF3|nr:TetR/AcrR family transcriptional regulator [Marinilongibacter aquaticus]UBM58812.1 TetR/AcrR family transcriptional regulator [Marinilongibacter aquaticus]